MTEELSVVAIDHMPVLEFWRKEHMFRALIEKSNDIILITSRTFRIKYITGSVEKLLGIKPQEAIGKSVFEFIDQQKETSLVEFIESNTKLDNKFTEVCLNSKDNQKVYFDVTISNLLENNKVNGLVINLHDITDRKLTEEKLVKTNNELDHFIYKTSHDLRAPLLSALGLVELAQNDPERDKYEYLEMIKTSLIKLDNFIDDINAFYRNEKLAIRKEKIDLEAIISDEIETLKNLYNSKHIDINLDISKVSDFFSDSIRIKTIVTNILSNAIKYSDNNKEKSFINIKIEIAPDTCVIQLQDNGIGIRGEYLEHIFEIFYRADENAKGSGLGLYIVKDTVDKLGGLIEVTSEYGKGTAFTISIPNFLKSINSELGFSRV